MGLDVELISPKQASQNVPPSLALLGPAEESGPPMPEGARIGPPTSGDVAALHEAVFTQTLMERRR